MFVKIIGSEIVYFIFSMCPEILLNRKIFGQISGDTFANVSNRLGNQLGYAEQLGIRIQGVTIE